MVMLALETAVGRVHSPEETQGVEQVVFWHRQTVVSRIGRWRCLGQVKGVCPGCNIAFSTEVKFMDILLACLWSLHWIMKENMNSLLWAREVS